MNFYHTGSRGDILYSLPAIIAMGGGRLIISKRDQYDVLHRLIKTQPYITDVVCSGEIKDNINLSTYRQHPAVLTQHLAKTYLDINNVSYDISKPWLVNIEKKRVSEIIIHRTERYHDGPDLDWKALKKYEKYCSFVGSVEEYKRFSKKINCPYYKCQDLLDMAMVIKGSDLFIGNQSVGLAIAESLKHPRIVEVCVSKNNCQPNSNNGHTFLSSKLIKYYLSPKIKKDVPTIIPETDIGNSPILKRIFTDSTEPVVYLPNYGEFGATVDKLIKIVHFHDAPYKIVCCKKGEEAYFPRANEFHYDWDDFVADEDKRGLFALRGKKQLYKNRLAADYEKIKEKLGNKYEYVHLWPFSDDRVYNRYTGFFRPVLKPKIEKGLIVDVVISPRLRASRPENNYPYWQEFAKIINKNGYTVGSVGGKKSSQVIKNSKINSWDFEDSSSATIEMLQKCQIYVGLDTGVSHLSSMLSVPMIVFSHANQKHYLTSFMKNLTTNYYEDLGKTFKSVEKLAEKTIAYLERKK